MDPATTEIYTLSLHDALPIYSRAARDPLHAEETEMKMMLGFPHLRDRKSTRLNSSHVAISYAVFCLKKKKKPASRPPMLAQLRAALILITSPLPDARAMSIPV